MPVFNKFPKTIANYAGSPEEWVNENSEWLKQALSLHKTLLTTVEVDKYQAAYDGELEKITDRDKSRGDDVNHQLQVDLAQLIIDTVVDYILGKPMSWTFEDPSGEAKKATLEAYRKDLLKLIRNESAQRVLAEFLRHGSIGGYDGLITWVDEEGNIDYEEYPMQEIVPIYDTRGRLRMVIRKYDVEENAGEEVVTFTKLEIYDKKYVLYLKTNADGDEYELDPDEIETGNPIQHWAARIPVSVFINGTPAKYEDRKHKAGVSDLAIVFSLLENMAGTVSDKANTVDRLLDQFLLLTNVDVDEKEVIKMRKARAIALKSKESAASFIAPNQNDQAVENHLDRVDDLIHKTSQTPKLDDLSGATATEIKVRYASMDIKAGKKETYFTAAVKEFIAILTDMLNAQRLVNDANVDKEEAYNYLVGKDIDGNPLKPPIDLYSPDWVQFTFNHNMPQNYLELAQIVSTLEGIVPDSYLYELLWFIEDPVAALAEMKKQKEETAKLQADAGLSAMGLGGEFGQTGGGTDPNNPDKGGGA